MRINRYLAACGLTSRRKADEWILAGRVSVNGVVLKDFGYEVQPEDRVCVDGQRVIRQAPVYYAFHKPIHTLCSHGDPHGKELIYSLLPKEEGLFSVGRLDYATEGLLLLTNDGAWAQAVAHPSKGVEKEYLAVVDRPVQAGFLRKLAQGVRFEGVSYAPAAAWEHRVDEWPHLSDWLADWPPEAPGGILHLCLQEGKKREVRQLLRSGGYEVQRLIRLRIGPLRLTGLRAGEYRALKPEEVQAWDNKSL